MYKKIDLCGYEHIPPEKGDSKKIYEAVSKLSKYVYLAKILS